MRVLRRRSLALLPTAVVASAVSVCAMLTMIGPDSRWLAALGGSIARTGSVPAGIPYASAPSHGWDNAPVLAELIFHWLESWLGDRGLVLAQVCAVTVALVLVAREAMLVAAPRTASVLVPLLVPAAAANAFLFARAQLFSLALFPLLVVLLRREARAPSRRIWLLVPLIALWSNLHGAVLVGLALAGCYLLLDRLPSRPAETTAVLAASVAALLATPAGAGTAHYYLGVLGNSWASAHAGLWARPSPSRPFDVLFAVLAVPLLAAAIRGRPRPWEWLGAVGLAIGVAQAARNEVWLVLFLALLAPHGLGKGRIRPVRPAVVALPIVIAAAGVALALVRGPSQLGAGSALQRKAIAVAAGTPILADPYDAEELALDGARVVIADPLDAFDPRAQRLYLDWTRGSPSARSELAPATRVVLANRGTAAQRQLARTPGFCEAAADEGSVLYVRGGRQGAIVTSVPIGVYGHTRAATDTGSSTQPTLCG